MPIPTGWIAVIGIEVHVQLASRSKVYAPEEVAYGAAPNTLVSPITLAHPGALPSVNQTCVDLALKMGLALNCRIPTDTPRHFSRKNYFYPDLPKGYQITQDTTPFCENGHLDIRLQDGTEKRIGITRIHMEEDAGKNLHDQDLYHSLVDFNRAGTGLIEIVSDPDLRTPEECAAYLAEIRKLVRYLGISDGNMEEGSLRADANVSVMRTGAERFGERAEVKNINSISNLAKAVQFEIDRQVALYEAGETMPQQTRTWDTATGETFLMRLKENADDYRYFPEPDLQPYVVYQAELDRLAAELPTLPRERYRHLTEALGLPDFDANLLSEQRELAEYFDAAFAFTQDAKQTANWILGPVRAWLNERALDITDFPLRAEGLAEAIQLVADGKVSLSVARDELFPAMVENPDTPAQTLAQQLNLLLDTDTAEIDAAIQDLLDENSEKVQTYLGGKSGLLGFFVGQLMRQFKGKADPKRINEQLNAALEARRTS